MSFSISGKFASDLYERIMNVLSKSSDENEWKNVLLYLDILRILVLANLAYVVNVQIVKDATLSDCDMTTGSLHEIPLSEKANFIDIQCYMSDNVDVKVLLVIMNSLINEKPDVRWAELDWFINT